MNICSLPTELKLHILSFLDTNFIRFVVARLNRDFYELSRDPVFYRYYDYKRYQRTAKIVKNALSSSLYTQHLRRLTIGARFLVHLKTQRFLSLKEIRITGYRVCDEELEALKIIAPNLRVLKLDAVLYIEDLIKSEELFGLLHPDTKVVLRNPVDFNTSVTCIFPVKVPSDIEKLNSCVGEETSTTDGGLHHRKLQLHVRTSFFTQVEFGKTPENIKTNNSE